MHRKKNAGSRRLTFAESESAELTRAPSPDACSELLLNAKATLRVVG